MEREMVFNGERHELVGNFTTKEEVRREAEYWRKRRWRARVVNCTEPRPYALYVSVSRRR